jgi:hypothetical protein
MMFLRSTDGPVTRHLRRLRQWRLKGRVYNKVTNRFYRDAGKAVSLRVSSFKKVSILIRGGQERRKLVYSLHRCRSCRSMRY